MSRHALVWASRQWGRFTTADGREVTPDHNDQAVLYTLADLADQRTGMCWPSVAHLLERLRMSKARFYAALELWQDLGLVEIQQRYTAAGRQRSNYYRVHLDKGKQPGAGGSKMRPRSRPDSYPMVARQGDPDIGPLDPIDPSINEDRMGNDAARLKRESAAPTASGAPLPGAQEVSQGSEVAYLARVERELAAAIAARGRTV